MHRLARATRVLTVREESRRSDAADAGTAEYNPTWGGTALSKGGHR